MTARPGARLRVGIDLGGTKLAAGVVDPEGSILGEELSYDHRGAGDDEVMRLIARNVDRALAKAGASRSDVKGAGVLYPGHIRWPEGVTLTSSNLPGLKDFPLRGRAEELLGIPCLADNDANAQALGEFTFGAGAGMDPMVLLTVSTGIGGGIIINGAPYRGFTGTAGEFGHMIIDADSGRRCTCGNRGCLMGIASGLAIAGTAREVAQRLAAAGACADLPSGCAGFPSLDGELLASGCAEGNELCREVVGEFARLVGVGLYNIFQVLNPRCVVLAGGLLNLPEYFFEGAVRTCYELAGPMMYDRMEIRRGSLGARAGVLGAAALFEA
jgi:glucokinase